MGTTYSDRIHAFCRENGLRYMPFVGEVVGRPSVLKGTIDSLIGEARACLAKGVYGFDLLAYRYEGDPSALIRRFVAEVEAPVCIAGSINRVERLDELRAVSPWGFTIGGAFFDHRFGGSTGSSATWRTDRPEGGRKTGHETEKAVLRHQSHLLRHLHEEGEL